MMYRHYIVFFVIMLCVQIFSGTPDMQQLRSEKLQEAQQKLEQLADSISSQRQQIIASARPGDDVKHQIVALLEMGELFQDRYDEINVKLNEYGCGLMWNKLPHHDLIEKFGGFRKGYADFCIYYANTEIIYRARDFFGKDVTVSSIYVVEQTKKNVSYFIGFIISFFVLTFYKKEELPFVPRFVIAIGLGVAFAAVVTTIF